MREACQTGTNDIRVLIRLTNIGIERSAKRQRDKHEGIFCTLGKGNTKRNNGVNLHSNTTIRPGMVENVTPYFCDCINVKLNKYTNIECWSSLMGDSSYHL
jgi:hypothetical protein